MTATERKARVTTDTPIHAIRVGDQFIHDGEVVWTAVTNPIHRDHVIRLDVQFADGGIATREWDDLPDATHTLTIRKAAA